MSCPHPSEPVERIVGDFSELVCRDCHARAEVIPGAKFTLTKIGEDEAGLPLFDLAPAAPSEPPYEVEIPDYGDEDPYRSREMALLALDAADEADGADLDLLEGPVDLLDEEDRAILAAYEAGEITGEEMDAAYGLYDES